MEPTGGNGAFETGIVDSPGNTTDEDRVIIGVETAVGVNDDASEIMVDNGSALEVEGTAFVERALRETAEAENVVPVPTPAAQVTPKAIARTKSRCILIDISRFWGSPYSTVTLLCRSDL